MVWDHGFRRLHIGVDGKSIVQILEWAQHSTNENAIIVKAIRELLARDWIIQMEHVYREANYAADFLTSYSLMLSVRKCIFIKEKIIILHFKFY